MKSDNKKIQQNTSTACYTDSVNMVLYGRRLVHVMHKTMKSSDKFLATFFLSFIVAGVAEGLAPPNAEWPFAFAISHTFVIAILLFAWCGAHADENKITPPSGSKLLTGIFPPLGVPYYMLAGYGLKNGGVKLIKAILFFVLCAGSYNGLLYVLHNA